MSLLEFAVILLGFLGLALGAVLVRGALLLYFSRREDFESAKYHSPSTLKEIANGQVSAYRNGRRDYAVSAGLALDLRTKKLQPQGRVSDELIEPLL